VYTNRTAQITPPFVFGKDKQIKMNSLKRKRGACLIDGSQEEIQNPMVEPIGVFIGRGNSKRNGRIKPRIVPEMVTVNCSV
jgi:hypothetical protein